MSLKDPSSRLVRWSILLQDHQFEPISRPGQKNSNVDALPRIKIQEEEKTTSEKEEINWDRSENLLKERMRNKMRQNFLPLWLISGGWVRNKDKTHGGRLLLRRNERMDGPRGWKKPKERPSGKKVALPTAQHAGSKAIWTRGNEYSETLTHNHEWEPLSAFVYRPFHEVGWSYSASWPKGRNNSKRICASNIAETWSSDTVIDGLRVEFLIEND